MTARRFFGMRLRPLLALLFCLLVASATTSAQEVEEQAILPSALKQSTAHTAPHNPPAPAAAPGAPVQRPTDPACARSAEYGCYTNHKYGYALAWPKRFVAPQGESDAGDGQAFRSPNGTIDLKCWGAFNTVLETSIPAAFDQALAEPGREVVYKHRGADFFVVSGYVDGNIFYRRTLLRHEVLATFEIVYAPGLKTALDPVVKDLAASFRIDPAFLWR